MYYYRTIIDKDFNIVDKCVLFIDEEPQYFEMKDNYMAVEQYRGNFIKPRWNDIEWCESATEEEIKEYEEANKIVQEPSENEMLMSNIILENATLKQRMEEQQELTSTLMLQIAELKGGNTNV